MTSLPSKTAKTVKPELIDAAIAALQNLPPKPQPLSMREMIARLQTFIKEAFAKGYNHEEVCQLLFTQGIDITPHGLRSHLAKLSSSTSPDAPVGKTSPTETRSEPNVSVKPAVQSVPEPVNPVIETDAPPEVTETIQPSTKPTAATHSPKPKPAKSTPPKKGQTQDSAAKTVASKAKSVVSVTPSSTAKTPAVKFSLQTLTLQSPYQKSASLTEALQAAFQNHPNQSLTIEDLVEILYGEVDQSVKSIVKSRFYTNLSRGKERGFWKLGRKPGTYTSVS